MIRLNLSNAARWIDLVPGVRLELLPVGTTQMLQVNQDIALAEEDAEEAPGTGGKSRSLALAQALAARVVIGWEGVGDVNGDPLPVTPEGLYALLEHLPVFTAFQEKVVRPAMELVDEGNGSALSPDGTSARA